MVDPLLSTTIPLISLGILINLLEGPSIGITRLVRIRKIFKSHIEIHYPNSSDVITIPLGEPIKINGILVCSSEYNKTSKQDDFNNIDITNDRHKMIPLKQQKIIFHDGEGGKNTAELPNATTSHDGKFEIKGNTPSVVKDKFKIKAHFPGIIKWNKRFFFTIEVILPSDSKKTLVYSTRLHKTALFVSCGIINGQGQLEQKNNFKVDETITFKILLVDQDTNQPISEEDKIKLRYNDNIINLLPTNENGETLITLKSPTIVSKGWTFQGFYPGNSIYSKSYSQLNNFNTIQ
jgi:hypothetical protein